MIAQAYGFGMVATMNYNIHLLIKLTCPITAQATAHPPGCPVLSWSLTASFSGVNGPSMDLIPRLHLFGIVQFFSGWE